MIVVRPAGPARLLAVLAPAVAILLVGIRAATTGLSAGPDDPASPWIVAVATVLLGCWLGWRAPSQRAELRVSELRCRNLVTSFSVDWAHVRSLVVVRRGPLTLVEVRISGHRRRLRVGAATRFTGESAEVVLDMLRAHPDAGSLLVDDHFEDRFDADGADGADGAADGAAGDDR
ncbi:MAG: hypothetical protein JST64_00685 [Actinobacteria bacterium]|nr:hypothetical protein [Actinomycetota bacterium]